MPRLAVRVVLPTPPLPEQIRTVREEEAVTGAGPAVRRPEIEGDSENYCPFVVVFAFLVSMTRTVSNDGGSDE